MKAHFRNPDISQAPKAIEPYTRNLFLTPEKDYDIYAISVFKGVTFFLVVTDANIPGYWPSWLFSITEKQIPHDWICNATLEWPELLIGPTFLAGSQNDYIETIEQHPKKIDQFWEVFKKKNAILPE